MIYDDKIEFLKELYKKFENIQHRNSVNSSSVSVYSGYFNTDAVLESSIGKLYINHFARTYCLDSERFVTYTLNPRIKKSVEEMCEYLKRRNIKYSVYKENFASYGYNIIISEDNHENK